MKRVFFILFIYFGLTLNIQAQSTIGKTTVTNASCLLEFGTEPRGIVLPVMIDASTSTVSPGVLAFDGATGSFRYYNGSWSDATPGGETGGAIAGTDDGNPAIMGAITTSDTGGALVLESPNKALVLPNVSNVADKMLTPRKGTLVWDGARQQVAVFDGNKWEYY